jgi:actin related protein 2/3 complex subunit 3
LYITECLRRLQKCQSRTQAQKELTSLAISSFPIPGDQDFPLNGMFAAPSSSEVGKFSLQSFCKEQYLNISFVDKMKQYLEQLRKECSDRMVNTVIDSETDKPSKV